MYLRYSSGILLSFGVRDGDLGLVLSCRFGDPGKHQKQA